MKKIFLCIFAGLFCFVSFAAAEQKFERFSKNAIGPLNVVGIALSENADSAKKIIQDVLKKQMKAELQFPVYLDPTYKQLGGEKALDISFFGQSATGKKYESNVDTILDLKANAATIIIVDRKKRVRGFTQALFADWGELGKLAEELLLNLDGKEIITIDCKSPDNEGLSTWQTDLGKENIEKGKGKTLTIDFGASKLYWYKYLGQTIPDVKFKKLESGEDATLYDAIEGKVSAILVFIAPENKGAYNALPGAASMITVADGLYKYFGLGQAKPGPKLVPNAQPDVK